jgi:hypothetical protein
MPAKDGKWVTTTDKDGATITTYETSRTSKVRKVEGKPLEKGN